jgi:hypothetical protein
MINSFVSNSFVDTTDNLLPNKADILSDSLPVSNADGCNKLFIAFKESITSLDRGFIFQDIIRDKKLIISIYIPDGVLETTPRIGANVIYWVEVYADHTSSTTFIKYMKIQDVLANLGGVISLFRGVFSLIFLFINHYDVSFTLFEETYLNPFNRNIDDQKRKSLLEPKINNFNSSAKNSIKHTGTLNSPVTRNSIKKGNDSIKDDMNIIYLNEDNQQPQLSFELKRQSQILSQAKFLTSNIKKSNSREDFNSVNNFSESSNTDIFANRDPLKEANIKSLKSRSAFEKNNFSNNEVNKQNISLDRMSGYYSSEPCKTEIKLAGNVSPSKFFKKEQINNSVLELKTKTDKFKLVKSGVQKIENLKIGTWVYLCACKKRDVSYKANIIIVDKINKELDVSNFLRIREEVLMMRSVLFKDTEGDLFFPKVNMEDIFFAINKNSSLTSGGYFDYLKKSFVEEKRKEIHPETKHRMMKAIQSRFNQLAS